MFWVLMTALAGVCTGTFGLPLKLNKRWKWENTWGVYAPWVLLIVPWVIAFATVPNLFQAYGQVAPKVLLLVILFGSCWGLGQIAFGKGLDYLGIGLGFFLQIGLILSIGSLMPLFFESPHLILKKQGLAVIAGVLVIVISIIIGGLAATMKEKDLAGSIDADADKPREKKTLRKGLTICLISGLLCPGLNYAYRFGVPLAKTAESLGAHKALAANAVLPLALIGGFFFNLGYAIHLLNKNKTWNLYQPKGNRIYFIYTSIMGIWTVGVALFGVSSTNMGELGGSVGWAVINAAQILWANVLGLLTGEWKGASRKTLTTMAIGSIVLLIGLCIVGWANAL